MLRRRLLILLTIWCIQRCTGYDLTVSQVDSLKRDIRKMIYDASNEFFDTKYQILLSGLPRLSFHDCVGGCDGCINPQHRDNKGLERYIDALEGYYQTIKQRTPVSRADFWNLVGIETITMAYENDICGSCTADPLPLIFRYGRTDCASGGPYTNENHTFPESGKSGKHTIDFFKQEFNMTKRQTVAIMGGHTMGRGHLEASGHNRRWVTKSTRFNNDYYTALLNSTFQWHMVQVQGVNNTLGKWQWETKDTGTIRSLMMLNVDMGLLFDLEGQINTTTGRVTGCQYSTCPINSETYSYLVEFASDNAEWLVAFADAYDVMSSRGYNTTELKLPIA